MKEAENRLTKRGFLGLWEKIKVPDEKVDEHRARLTKIVNSYADRFSHLSHLTSQLAMERPVGEIDKAAKADRDWVQKQLNRLDKKPDAWKVSRVLWFRPKVSLDL